MTEEKRAAIMADNKAMADRALRVLTTAILEVPFLANAFGFTPVGLAEYGIAMALAILVIPIVEIVKAVQRKCGK